jgi:hypothetical protein
MVQRPDSKLLEALSGLARGLKDIKAPSMVIGGIAVIAHGVPRQTVDVDATVWAAHLETTQVLKALSTFSIQPRIADVLDFARRSQVLLLRHEPTGVPIEVSLAWAPFEEEALGRASEIDFAGVLIPVATPEDLLIYKVLAWRDRDRYDIEQLLTLYGDAVDLEKIRNFVREFAQILEDPGRVDGFEAILRRVRAVG